MKYFLAAILFLHGAIHILGFLKAFRLAQLQQLISPISKTAGGFWLLTFLLFMTAGISYLLNVNWWFFPAFIGMLISTILIISGWTDAKFGTIANVVILIAVIISFSGWTYFHRYLREVNKGIQRTSVIQEPLLTEKDMEPLPAAIKKYIRYTGSIGKPRVNNFKLVFIGKLRKTEQSEWMPFHSEQFNFLADSWRFFYLTAVMKNLPVAGFHCFKNGTAFMDIRLFSLIRVQYQEGKEMGIAETVTFFNDMCLMAPATLIDKRIKWIESDSSRVKAEFTNNNITISAELFFNEKGELVNFISPDRYAVNENKHMDRLTWSTPAKNYREIDGFKLAGYAEAIYKYPQGDLCYGTFELQHVSYNISQVE